MNWGDTTVQPQGSVRPILRNPCGHLRPSAGSRAVGQRLPVAELPRRHAARVRTYEGMRLVFRETMTDREVREYTLIQPWLLLDAWADVDLEEARVKT